MAKGKTVLIVLPFGSTSQILAKDLFYNGGWNLLIFWENIFSVERAANYCFNDIVLFSLTAQFPNKDPEGGPVFPHLRVFVPNLYENSKFFDILSKGAVRWKNIL